MPEFALPIINPVLIFALVMLIILIAPLLFNRIRIPGLVGLIVAGVVVGPHALGLLQRDETIELLGTVGLLYIMFVAGLEIDLNQFQKFRRQSLLFSLMTYGIPQVLGWGVAFTLLGFGWPSAILMGSILASHTLVAYPIVSRLGLTKNAAVTTAVGATIVTDSMALLVLAVIAGSAEGEVGTGFWIRLITLLTIYVAGVFLLVPRLGRWFFRSVGEADGVSGFVFVLAVVFSSAFLAEVAGVEPIIGAFLAGLALNRLVPELGTLMNRIQFVGNSLFIPFFLISVGMLVDIQAFIVDTSAWLTAGVIVSAVLVSKWSAAFLTKWVFGFSTEECWTIFGLTIAQAAATLAAVLIGFEIGLLDESVLNATILMILVTCLMGPWITEKYGRRLALSEGHEPFKPTEIKQRILVPITSDGSVEQLMEFALLIRDPKSDQPIFPLNVVPEGAMVKSKVARNARLMEHPVRHGVAAEVPVVPLTRIDRDISNGIQRAVIEEQITTLLLKWDGKNLDRHYTFGRVVDPLLDKTREMVIITHLKQPPNTLQRVVVTFPPFIDREVGFPLALRTIKVLSGQIGTGLLILCTVGAREQLEPVLLQTRPEVEFNIEVLSNWSELPDTLQNQLRPNDLLVNMSVRQGSLAWRPSMEHWPNILARRFAEISTIFLYLSEIAFDAETTSEHDTEERTIQLITTAKIHFEEGEPSWRETLIRMIAPTFGSNEEELARTVAALQDRRSGYSTEQLPGLILLHAYVPVIQEPELHVAVSHHGFKIPNTAQPAHLLFVLLNPEYPSSEAYLNRLSNVARIVRPHGIVDRLRSSRKEEEIRNVLKGNMRERLAAA